MSGPAPGRRALSGDAALARIAAAALLVGTVAAQHPVHGFGRAARLDFFATLFPNWRFFAPHPAEHDSRLFYRTLSHDGETSRWALVDVIAGRRFRQIAWYPGRRVEKAVFDLCSDLLLHLHKGLEHMAAQPSYRVLVEFLRARIERAGDAAAVKGFQFCLARAAGYDESEEPAIVFVSPYTPMSAPGAVLANEV